MPSEILAIGTTALNSVDQVIASGATLTVGLMDIAGPSVDPLCRVDILIKASNNQYFLVDTLGMGRNQLVIAAAGTYRFSRPANGPSCGVFGG